MPAKFVHRINASKKTTHVAEASRLTARLHNPSFRVFRVYRGSKCLKSVHSAVSEYQWLKLPLLTM
jgi:hypothetical protein